MIKERDLVPGRVITTAEKKRVDGREVTIVTAWLIVGFTTRVRRRHNNGKAPKEGWHVMLLSFGGRLMDVDITPSTFWKYKRLF